MKTKIDRVWHEVQNKLAIRANVKVHDAIAGEYEVTHPEIFNVTEQNRLRDELKNAISLIDTGSMSLEALDFGTGSGNMTRHLIDFGFYVTATDISKEFLKLIETRFGAHNCKTILTNGSNLEGIPDNKFDLVVAYSVLHHILNYSMAVRELLRVLKPGGVLFCDHEANPAYWNPTPDLKAYRNSCVQTPRLKKTFWQKVLQLSYLKWWKIKWQKLAQPRFQEEGDIHVWQDDHIEWDLIERVINESSGHIICKKDYLLCREIAKDPALFSTYKDKCSDMRCLIARKSIDA